MSTTIKTKFGRASINGDGYYQIRSRKEGNMGKYLHRLIFEDFYQIKLPSNIFIHHDDEDKTNNEMWNLIPMTREEHTKLHKTGENNHMFGKHHSKKGKINISKSQNTTGFFRVSKHTKNSCKQGFYWNYIYKDENLNKHEITSTNLKTLKEKVIAQGLDWEILDKHLAEKSMEESREHILKRAEEHSTGVRNVMKHLNKNIKQGFSWKYEIVINKQRISFTSINPQKLKEKVINAGFDWIILDEDKAMGNGLL